MSVPRRDIDRRRFLQGKMVPPGAPSARRDRFLYIASAVVTARPEQCAGIARLIADLPETEVHAVEGSKIVVVMESQVHGEIGSRLATMSLMDGVFSANLVLERIEPLDDNGAGS
ncbi:chaperone NapD [Xanthobacteraceae bacterium A53D]